MVFWFYNYVFRYEKLMKLDFSKFKGSMDIIDLKSNYLGITRFN